MKDLTHRKHTVNRNIFMNGLTVKGQWLWDKAMRYHIKAMNTMRRKGGAQGLSTLFS